MGGICQEVKGGISVRGILANKQQVLESGGGNYVGANSNGGKRISGG